MPNYSQVKICGLRTREAVEAAVLAGADYIGLVFFTKSPRNVDVDTARDLAQTARELRKPIAASGNGSQMATEKAAPSLKLPHPAVVALLVDPDDELLDQVATNVLPDVIQLHGSESPERVAEIRKRYDIPVMKAIGVRETGDAAVADRYYDPGNIADLILFDAKPPRDAGSAKLPGGNGLTFDWHILDDVRDCLPFALAGGLRPENVAEAIRLTGAPIVDVSSGVERAPGEKDPELIRLFLNAAKKANQKA